MKKLLPGLIVLLLIVAGCGEADSSNSSPNTNTSTSKDTGITEGSVGEALSVTDDRGEELYQVTVSTPATPYTAPADGAGIIFDLDPGYKFTKIKIKIENDTKYPAFYSPVEYLLIDERDQVSLQSGVVEPSQGDEILCVGGGEILPGKSMECSLVFQLPEASSPRFLQVQPTSVDKAFVVDLS